MKTREYVKKLLLFLLVAAIAGGAYYKWGPNQIHTKQLNLTGYKRMRVKSVTAKEITEKKVYEELGNDGIFRRIRDEKIKKGDIVNVTIKGFVDGIVRSDMSMKDYDLEIGSNTFIEGFEDGLIGEVPGNEKVLDLTFPDTYSNADYAGKEVRFRVKIHYIKENYTKDTLTDAIVEKETSCETKEELYQKTKKELQEQEKQRIESKQKEDLWKALLKKAELIDYPESYWAKEIEAFDQSYEEHAKSLNLTKEEFLKQYFGYDSREYAALREETCEMNVKKRIIIEEIAQKEGMKADSYAKLEKKVEKFLMERTKFISR